MYRIHSNLVNDNITVLEEGDNRFFAFDKVVLEPTEMEVLCNTDLNSDTVKSIYQIKKMFDGQVVCYTTCPICGAKVIKEIDDELALTWLFEPNSEVLHQCK